LSGNPAILSGVSALMDVIRQVVEEWCQLADAEDVVMNLKGQLKLYLEHTGMSASQLAKKSSVPRQSLSDWISGSKPRDIAQVKRVAEVLGTSVDHLVFGNGLDNKSQKITELDALLGDEWISGLFEVRFRRVRK
jgi:transcriptional regulator with XRE-family HTH domain